MEDVQSRLASESKEKFAELRTTYGFGDNEVACFEMNHGELNAGKMSLFEAFLENEKVKRMPKKQLLGTARPLTARWAQGPADLKRSSGSNVVTTPITKRTREAAGDLDAGTPTPPSKPSHQISVKSSINTGNLQKIPLSSTANVKLLGDCFWTGQDGQSAYTWMDEALSERAIRRDERLQEWEAPITSLLQQRVQEAVIGAVGVPSQVETILCGRIACEGLDGRLNEQSMLLEGSTLAAGAKVQLNVANCQHLAAVPGQIVGVVGRSGMTGNTFHAHEFLPGLPQQAQPLGENCALHAAVIAGPFSKKKELDFAALESVLAEVAASSERPEVLIIFGPFLDCNNDKVVSGEVHLPGREEPCSFEEIYAVLFAMLARNLQPLRRANPPTEVLIVPSLDEVAAFHPLPQPPLDVVMGSYLMASKDSLESLQRLGVRFLPNPVHLEINGIKVSLSSADALTPVIRELVLRCPSGQRKMDEALRLLLRQRCLFPMVPREPAQVYEARAQALDFPGGAPHLCIFPSIAGLSATVADDTLFVNPGFLCKSGALGSFAELWIAPGGASTLKDRIRVDVKKLE